MKWGGTEMYVETQSGKGGALNKQARQASLSGKMGQVLVAELEVEPVVNLVVKQSHLVSIYNARLV